MNDELDLMDIWRVLRKNAKRIAVLCCAAVLITGVVTYFFIPRKYQSSITFYIQDKGSGGSSMLSAMASQLGALGGLVPSLGGGTTAELCGEIIKSRQILAGVLSEGGLPHSPKDVRKFSDLVTVENKKSGAVAVRVIWKNPRTAYLLTKALFARYKEFVEENIHGTSSTNRRFLQEQYEKSRDRLARAEADLLDFQKKKGILLLPDQAVKEIEYFAELERQKSEAEVGLTEAGRRVKEAGDLLGKEAPMVKAQLTETINPILQQYRTSLTEIEIKLAEARMEYTDQHPAVKALLTQREELLAKIAAEKETILSGQTVAANPVYQTLAGGYLQGRIEVAGLETRRQALDRVYAKYDRLLADLPDDMHEYGRKLREQKVAEQIYLLLTTQLEQAKISEAKEVNVVIQVIDPAFIPDKKHSPSTTLNAAVAGFLALMIGVMLAFLQEYVRNYRKEPDRAAGNVM